MDNLRFHLSSVSVRFFDFRIPCNSVLDPHSIPPSQRATTIADDLPQTHTYVRSQHCVNDILSYYRIRNEFSNEPVALRHPKITPASKRDRIVAAAVPLSSLFRPTFIWRLFVANTSFHAANSCFDASRHEKQSRPLRLGIISNRKRARLKDFAFSWSVARTNDAVICEERCVVAPRPLVLLHLAPSSRGFLLDFV